MSSALERCRKTKNHFSFLKEILNNFAIFGAIKTITITMYTYKDKQRDQPIFEWKMSFFIEMLSLLKTDGKQFLLKYFVVL